MNQEEAIVRIFAAISKGEVDEPEHFELLCAAVELGIRAVYRAGLEIREKDGIRDFLGND